MIYCYNDPYSWGRDLQAYIERRKGSAQMMTHATQVPDESGTYAFIHQSPKERDYTKDLAEDIARKTNVNLIPNIELCRLHDELIRQFRLYGAWMPTSWLFRSIEESTSFINDLPYPIISTSNQSHVINRHFLESPDDAFEEMNVVFRGEGRPIAGGNKAQKDYVFWQVNAARNEVRWHVFMAAKRYAYILQVPEGFNPYDPATPINTIEIVNEQLIEVLKFVYAFCFEYDLNWAVAEVMAGVDPVRQLATPFIMGVRTSWPNWWIERGGMVFESDNGEAWTSTGVPAVRVLDVMAGAILEGRFA